jgi:hypothetical protein
MSRRVENGSARSGSGAPRSAERGIALPIALFALIVIGALVSGNFFAGRLEQQTGQSTLFAAQALEAAEAGLSDAVANSNARVLEALPVGGSGAVLERLELAPGIRVDRQLTRLSSNVFLLRATGSRYRPDGVPLGVRSLGLLVRLGAASPDDSSLTPPLSALGERAWFHMY